MTRSKKAAQGEATREALISAALEEFGQHGYAETSVDEIVGRASVTKGAFYHHFANKERLFLQVFERVKRELSRAAFVVHVDHEPFAARDERPRRLKRFAEQDNTEVWGELLDRCRRYIELHTDPKVRRIVLVDAHWVLPWEDLQRVENEYGITLLRADLRRAMQRGIIDRTPLHTLAALVAGMLNEACLFIVHAESGQEALDEVMTVIRQMLEGLRTPGNGETGPAG